jgi:DUF1680 family protein
MSLVAADRLVAVPGATLHEGSFLGERVAGNTRRLQTVPLDPLLAGYEHRPGTHPWIGEHIGKWLHAATTTWQDTSDPVLAGRLREAVDRLVATQEPDGYLGTYEPGRRLGNYPDADWDVWSHKYCMIGLLAYHRATGDPSALAACVRAADLLLSTFGDEPGKRDLVEGAWHMGMAPSSVLEPIVLLHLLTGEQRFLAFADYVLRAWDGPGGPRVRSTLLQTGRVSEVGNGKAYEMLSCLLGLLELYRATGEAGHLDAVRAAWDDVVAHHLYVTGTASFLEHFHGPDELPDSLSVNMGETCVTVTWLQLTRQLLALTGEARYAEELEHTVYNHLSAAQRPDGQAWSYYTPLNGTRDHGSGISCCISSGPRGMALVPPSVFWSSGADLVVALYTAASATVTVAGASGRIRWETHPDRDRGGLLTFEDPLRCGVRLRVPEWAPGIAVPGGASGDDGWVRLPERDYAAGDQVRVLFDVDLRPLPGLGWNAGRVALARGPLVLARTSAEGTLECFEPFATAADHDRDCQVWLPVTPGPREVSVLQNAVQEQSSGDMRRASINDGDPWSYAVTEGDDDHAWFALLSVEPVTFSRVAFVHGRCMVHGGWFDSSGAKPSFQVQPEAGGEWVEIAALDDYPDTTVADGLGLEAGTRFDLSLPAPLTAYGLRIVGPGSWGDWPGQRIATCALLQAY